MEIVSRPSLETILHPQEPARRDKREYAFIARKILSATGYPVAVINYRLTPDANKDPAHRHPIHAQDLLDFLSFIVDWKDPPCAFDASRLVLIGHSCSAHMISCILLDSNDPLLQPPPHVLCAVKAVITSEGIYDIDNLLKRFPTYRDWFIEPTFGPLDSYNKFSVLNFPPRQHSSPIRWLLLHSKGDTLVDMGQTIAMHEYLARSEIIHAEIDTCSLIDEHNDVLQTDVYAEIIKNFIYTLQ